MNGTRTCRYGPTTDVLLPRSQAFVTAAFHFGGAMSIRTNV